jgi:small basic protein
VVLKDVIDWTSPLRPQPFSGKQGLLMSALRSTAGGDRAQVGEAFDTVGQIAGSLPNVVATAAIALVCSAQSH